MTCIAGIDIGPIAANIPDDKIAEHDLIIVGKEILKAFTTIGFCNLLNHGMSSDVMEKAFDVARQFFELPVAEKLKNARTNPGSDFYGWTPNGNMKAPEIKSSMLEYATAEKKLDHKEAYNLHRESPIDKFPERVPELRQNALQMNDYYNLLVRRILHALGFALNLEDPKALLRYVRKLGTIENDSGMRYAYYPRVEPEDINEGDMRCGEHSDSGLLTLLFWNKVSGLQVLIDGQFTDAPNVPGAILLNVGDSLMHLTGGVLVSTRHRVVLNPALASSDRYSIVYFAGPDSAEVIECLCGDEAKCKSGLTGGELQLYFLRKHYEK